MHVYTFIDHNYSKVKDIKIAKNISLFHGHNHTFLLLFSDLILLSFSIYYVSHF